MEDLCSPTEGCVSDWAVDCCGNGIIEEGEACDDANPINGDGCEDSCLITETGPCAGVTCPSDQVCDHGFCVGGLLVTEFLANPGAVTDDKGEWVELFNAGPNPILYDAIFLADAVSDFEAITEGSGLILEVGEFLLVARHSDPLVNGGMTNVGGLFSFFLNNTGDTIYVRVGGEIVDVLDYTSFGNTLGTSKQLSEGLPLNPGTNDDGGNWCNGTEGFGDGVELGTPGEPNLPCP
jgi:cysteine-rich repeat protein